MMRWWILFLLAPGLLRAQAPELRIQGAGEPARFVAAGQRGHAAYPATALGALGARVEPHARGARVVLFGDTLVFESRSPVFLAGGRPQQLVAPVYRHGDTVYLPLQLFTEWLPARYPDRLAFRDGVLALARAAGGATASARTASPGNRTVARGQRGGGNGGGGRQTRIVVIDAGHGGMDPGKPGPNGLREKDVTLGVSRRLARILQERGGYEVHLTRTRDTLIALADRPRMANRWKDGRPAALFVSIHANSGPGSAQGFETFFLSEARTEDERRVAEMENAVIAFEEASTAAPADDLGWILNNLRNDFYMRASNDFAEVIQRRLGNFHPGPNRGVKQAGFRVLVGAFMPAVLVELAFISNRKEAALLANDGFQRQVAGALAEAIDDFFATHEHLLVAERRNGGEP